VLGGAYDPGVGHGDGLLPKALKLHRKIFIGCPSVRLKAACQASPVAIQRCPVICDNQRSKYAVIVFE